jgi:predicted ABC-type ATPase
MSGKGPVFVMIAGPNGSGKSSITKELQVVQSDFPKLYINADEIKKQFSLSDRDAQKRAEEMRRAAVDRRESFAFETVMSHVSKIDFMREVKQKGYEVRLYFITTQDPDINKIRVSQRVSEGGHHVPPDKIEPRYERSMVLLPLALVHADRAEVYNNSFDDPRLIIEKSSERGVQIYPQPAPSKWSRERIAELMKGTKEALKLYNQQQQTKGYEGPNY